MDYFPKDKRKSIIKGRRLFLIELFIDCYSYFGLI